MTDRDAHTADRIDRLIDAIDLLRENRRAEAYTLLRQLIHEDNDFEEAWLWMSVAVDSLDQSSICLDNVLRVNPKNAEAAGALSRLKASEIQVEKKRSRLRFYRDLSLTAMWFLVMFIIFDAFFTYMAGTW